MRTTSLAGNDNYRQPRNEIIWWRMAREWIYGVMPSRTRYTTAVSNTTSGRSYSRTQTFLRAGPAGRYNYITAERSGPLHPTQLNSPSHRAVAVVARTMPYRAVRIRYNGPRRSAIGRSFRNAIARLSYWQCDPRRCGVPETKKRAGRLS